MKPNILVLHHNKTMSPKTIFIAFDMQLLSCWKFNLCQNSSHFFMSEQLKNKQIKNIFGQNWEKKSYVDIFQNPPPSYVDKHEHFTKPPPPYWLPGLCMTP